MKYHDSIKEADEIMTVSVNQLKQWCLPVTPINYAVSYEYHKKSNKLLIKNIQNQLAITEHLDCFFMEAIFKDFVLEQSKFRNEIISDLTKLLNTAQLSCQQSSTSSETLISELDKNIPQLMSNDETTVKQAIASLQESTLAFKKQQQQIATQLHASQQQNQLLAAELAEVRQEINLDPVTGLFNKKSMQQHIDSWLKRDINCTINAIVVRVNHFNQFSNRYGVLLADVILAKVANKVASYVDDSGLPARTGHDEFVLLLPNIDNGIANEVGKKISQGVKKLRFVSVKSGVKLPQISVSFAVSEMKKGEALTAFINRTGQIIPPIK